jgi:hypothetical protein
VLDGDLLAHIFIGTITSWADPAILALNDNLTAANLPDVPITMSFTETLIGTAGSQVFKDALSIFNSTFAQRLSETGGLLAGLPPFAKGKAQQTDSPADRIAYVKVGVLQSFSVIDERVVDQWDDLRWWVVGGGSFSEYGLQPYVQPYDAAWARTRPTTLQLTVLGAVAVAPRTIPPPADGNNAIICAQCSCDWGGNRGWLS